MPTSIAFGLLRSVINGGASFTSMNEIGIGEEHFRPGKERSAYAFIRNYVTDHGMLPQLDTVSIEIDERDCWNNLTDEPPEFWANRLHERRRVEIINSGMRDVQNSLEGSNVNRAVELLGSTYIGLRNTYSHGRVVDLRDSQRNVIEIHHRVQQSQSIPGISFGIPYIDSVSGGAQSGDYISIAGETGVGKTNLSLKIALSGFYSGKNVLYISTELPIVQLSRRLLGMEARVSTSNLKLGKLSYFGVQRARSVIDRVISIDGDNVDNFFKILPGGIYANVDDIIIVCKELNPDILIIDGAYLLRILNFKGNRWDRMIEVADRLKNFSMVEGTPSLATYQFNKRQKGQPEGIYGATAVAHISSMMFSFEYERLEDVEDTNPVQYRLLRFMKGRDGESGTVRVLYDMLNTSIEQDRVITGMGGIDIDETEPSGADPDPYAEI